MLCPQSEFDNACRAYFSSTLPRAPMTLGARLELAMALIATTLALLPPAEKSEVRAVVVERVQSEVALTAPKDLLIERPFQSPRINVA